MYSSLESIFLYRASTDVVTIIERPQLDRLIYPDYSIQPFADITNPPLVDEGRLPRVRYCDLPEKVRKMIYGRYCEECAVRGYATEEIRSFGLDSKFYVLDRSTDSGDGVKRYVRTSIAEFLHPALTKILKDNLLNTDYIVVVGL